MLLIMQLQTITQDRSNCISTAAHTHTQQFTIYNLHYKVIISATVRPPSFSPQKPTAQFPQFCLANEVQNQRDVHRANSIWPFDY